jgi:hypothetical protein
VLRLEAGPDRRWRRMRFSPMSQVPGQGPAPDSTGAVLELLRTLSREDFGEAGARVREDGEILLPE